jgi:hypothetical protein
MDRKYYTSTSTSTLFAEFLCLYDEHVVGRLRKAHQIRYSYDGTTGGVESGIQTLKFHESRKNSSDTIRSCSLPLSSRRSWQKCVAAYRSFNASDWLPEISLACFFSPRAFFRCSSIDVQAGRKFLRISYVGNRWPSKDD